MPWRRFVRCQRKKDTPTLYSPPAAPLCALEEACFPPSRIYPQHSAGFRVTGHARNSSAVRRAFRRIGGATGGTASRQRLSAAFDRWKFVSQRPAIRSARAAPCAPASCFAPSREASSLPAQSSPLETSRFLTPRPQADQMSPGRNSGCRW